VLVRLDHVASRILDANHSTMWAAVIRRVSDCIAGCAWLAVPQPTEWQRTENHIDAALIVARKNFVNVHENPQPLAGALR